MSSTPLATSPPPAFDPENPGHWKLQLLLTGLEVSAELAEEFEQATGVPVTHRLLVELPRGLLCLARLRVTSRRSAEAGACTLSTGEEGWTLRRGEVGVPVKVRPPIESSLWGRVLRIDDSVLCDLSREQWGAPLRAHYGFPREPAQAAPQTPDPVLDAIEEIARRRTLRSVHVIAYDDPAGEDWDSAPVRLIPLFQAVHRNFATALSLECWPPAGVGALEQAYAAGVDQLHFHLTTHSARQAAGWVPERGALSTKRYEQAFLAAGEILEGGALKSALFLGEEPDALARAVQRLLKKGVVPLIWLNPLQAGAPWPRAAGALAQVATWLARGRPNLARVEERVFQLPPSELRYFHPENRAIVAGLQSAADTGIGRAAQRNLAALRRHLRVRGEPQEGGAGR